MAKDIAPYLTAKRLFTIVDQFSIRYSSTRVYELPLTSGENNLRLIHVTHDANNASVYKPNALTTANTFASPSTLELPEFDPGKFGVLIMGGQHGDEYAAPEVLVDVAEILAKREEFVCKDFHFTPDKIDAILRHVELFILPILNGEGRDNRTREVTRGFFGGVVIDPNRNWPFVWGKKVWLAKNRQFPYYLPGVATFNANAGGAAGDLDLVQLGVALVDLLPVNLFIDAHTELHGPNTPGAISCPWDIEDTGNNVANSFLTGPWAAPKADGFGAAAYTEFLPAGTQAAHQRYAAAITAATAKAYYPFSTLPTAGTYEGSAEAYAQSRDVCWMRALSLEINIGPLLQPPYAGNPAIDDATKQKIRDAVVQLRLSYTAAILAALDAFVDDIHAGRIQRPVARPNWFSVKPATDCASEPIPPHEAVPPPQDVPKPKKYYFLTPLVRFLLALLSLVRAFWPALVGFVRTLLGAFGIGWSSPVAPAAPPVGTAAPPLTVTLDPYTFHYLFVGGPGQQIGEFGFSWRSNGGAAATVSLQIRSYTYGWSPIPGFQNKPPVGSGVWQWVPQPGQTLWFRAMIQDSGVVAYSAEQRFQ